MENTPKTQILAVGGGKGGVGKSFVAAGLATALAGMGRKALIIDLDLGGANLHTIFGLKVTERGIGDFIYTHRSDNLADFAVDTGIENLKLISGNGFIPGIANLTYQQKVRVLKAITRLNMDYIILDLGAGTNYNVIDFFSITQSGIVVTISEPTAVLNAYEFLKNVLFRIFSKHFSRQPEVMEVIDAFKVNAGEQSALDSLARAVGAVDPAAEDVMRSICSSFRPGLIINMSRGGGSGLGQSLREICRNFLGIEVAFLGEVPSEDAVRQSLLRMSPVLVEAPDSGAAEALRAIARKTIAGRWMDRGQAEALAEAVADGEPEDGARRQTQKIFDLLKGHKDGELSSLLSGFLKNVAADVRKHETAEPPEEGRSTPAAAPPLPDELPLSDLLSFEPRMDPRTTIPRFIPLPLEPAVRRPSRFARWFQGETETDELIRRIRTVAGAENVALAIEQADDPSYPADRQIGRAWLETGMKLVEMNQLSCATLAFARAQANLPGNAIVANNWGATLLAAGTVKPAADCLQEGLDRAPDNPVLLFNVGLAQFALRKYDRARAVFQKLREHHDRTPATLSLLAFCLYHGARYAEARALFEEILSRDARDTAARFNTGLCQLRENLFAEAATTYTSCLFFAPEDAEALACRALAAWYIGDRNEALQDLAAAVKKQPSNLSLRAIRGTLCYLMGRYDKAIEDIHVITQLLPDNQKYREMLGVIRARLHADD